MVVGWDVGDNGAREEVLVLKGEGVGEGLEGGAGGAGREGPVDLTAVGAGKVGGAVEGEDFACLVFDDDEGAVLNVFVFETGEFFAKDFPGFVLELGVYADSGPFSSEDDVDIGHGVMDAW